MPQMVRYKGETTKAKGLDANSSPIEVELVNNESYNIEIEMQGPQMMINGMQMIHPDSTLWVHVNNNRVPYSKECLERNWDVRL